MVLFCALWQLAVAMIASAAGLTKEGCQPFGSHAFGAHLAGVVLFPISMFITAGVTVFDKLAALGSPFVCCGGLMKKT